MARAPGARWRVTHTEAGRYSDSSGKVSGDRPVTAGSAVAEVIRSRRKTRQPRRCRSWPRRYERPSRMKQMSGCTCRSQTRPSPSEWLKYTMPRWAAVDEQTVRARVDRLEPTRQHVGRRRGRDGSSTQRPRQQAFELGGHDCGVRRPGAVSFETCPLEHEQGRDDPRASRPRLPVKPRCEVVCALGARCRPTQTWRGPCSRCAAHIQPRPDEVGVLAARCLLNPDVSGSALPARCRSTPTWRSSQSRP